MFKASDKIYKSMKVRYKKKTEQKKVKIYSEKNFNGFMIELDVDHYDCQDFRGGRDDTT